MSVTMQSEPLPDFLCFNELISESNGGKVIFATDDFFAPAENLLKDEEPTWREGLYTDFGKWMDGWETRRKRQAGYDWAIIRMPATCIIKGVCVDTCHFTGNYAPRFSIAVANIDDPDFLQDRRSRMGTEATVPEKMRVAALNSEEWQTLVPISELKPGCPETRRNYFAVNSSEPWNCLRLNIFPDGGVARLRVYGVVKLNPRALSRTDMIDLVSKENGGMCVAYSNAHFGHPRNLIKPEPATGMADGWETARDPNRSPVVRVVQGNMQTHHHEWAIFKLGCVGRIREIIVDTSHFRGNCPHDILIKGTALHRFYDDPRYADWKTILPKIRLPANAEYKASVPKHRMKHFTHVKVIIAPDGGFARLRIMGLPSVPQDDSHSWRAQSSQDSDQQKINPDECPALPTLEQSQSACVRT